MRKAIGRPESIHYLLYALLSKIALLDKFPSNWLQLDLLWAIIGTELLLAGLPVPDAVYLYLWLATHNITVSYIV